jgi:hypothetical protein
MKLNDKNNKKTGEKGPNSPLVQGPFGERVYGKTHRADGQGYPTIFFAITTPESLPEASTKTRRKIRDPTCKSTLSAWSIPL